MLFLECTFYTSSSLLYKQYPFDAERTTFFGPLFSVQFVDAERDPVIYDGF